MIFLHWLLPGGVRPNTIRILLYCAAFALGLLLVLRVYLNTSRYRTCARCKGRIPVVRRLTEQPFCTTRCFLLERQELQQSALQQLKETGDLLNMNVMFPNRQGEQK